MPNPEPSELQSPARSASNLIWIDLEFTHLDPSQGFIMQAAMIVTAADLTPIPPPGIPAEVGGLIFDVAMSESQAASASDWVREHQAEHLERSQGPDALPIEKVAELFVAYLLTCCEIPEDIRQRPLLAGNSVQGDQRYLNTHMPELTKLLSYRLLDVTTLKELARRWCPSLEFSKSQKTIQRFYPSEVKVEGEAHDALFDIKGSIAELNYYRQHLFGPAARGETAQ